MLFKQLLAWMVRFLQRKLLMNIFLVMPKISVSIQTTQPKLVSWSTLKGANFTINITYTLHNIPEIENAVQPQIWEQQCWKQLTQMYQNIRRQCGWTKHARFLTQKLLIAQCNIAMHLMLNPHSTMDQVVQRNFILTLLVLIQFSSIEGLEMVYYGWAGTQNKSIRKHGRQICKR